MTWQEWYDNLLPEDFDNRFDEELAKERENYFDNLAEDWFYDAC